MATYYVDGAVGNDSNLGTSEGSGNAWATIDKGMNTVAAGDWVYVKASATYSETATIDTAGTAAAPIWFIGYTSTPGDGGQATIDGGSVRASAIAYSTSSSTSIHYRFDNFIGQNCTGTAFNSPRTARFVNCLAQNNSGQGFTCGIYHAMIDCTALACVHGLSVASGHFVHCVAGNSTSIGIWCNSQLGTIVGCLSYSSVLNGIKNDAGSTAYACLNYNNTVDGDAKDTNEAYEWDGAYTALAINNIAYDSVTGQMANSSRSNAHTFTRNNLYSNNTTDVGSNWPTDATDITAGDADFTDETTQDYSLQDTSDALGAGRGPGTWNIGAWQEPRLAAGALITHPGMTGGING